MTDSVAIYGRSGGIQQNKGMLFWGVVGLIAQIAFMAGWLIAETWQGPGYSAIKYTISDLQAATAPHVWFPIVCFAVGGLGTFGFAVFGLRPALAKAQKVAAHATWMLAFSALALGNSFPLIPFRLMDPGANAHAQLISPGGLTDVIVSSIAFLVLVFTPSQLLKRFATLPEWQRLKPVMITARAVCPICFLLLSASSIAGSFQGLAERILVTSCVLWMCALAINLISISRRANASQIGTE
jgi:hypothetical protein